MVLAADMTTDFPASAGPADLGDDSERVFVALGSNQEGPESQLRRAIDRLDDERDIRLVARSSLYRTPPWGVLEQPAFINAVVELRTELSPLALLARMAEMEEAAGRRRELRWGPRVLDLDLLLFGQRVVDTPTLTLPHPEMTRRAFVLVPLLELAPDLQLPELGRVDGFLIGLDRSGIEPVD